MTTMAMTTTTTKLDAKVSLRRSLGKPYLPPPRARSSCVRSERRRRRVTTTAAGRRRGTRGASRRASSFPRGDHTKTERERERERERVPPLLLSPLSSFERDGRRGGRGGGEQRLRARRLLDAGWLLPLAAVDNPDVCDFELVSAVYASAIHFARVLCPSIGE